jgi:hypothetical protein
VKEEKETFRMWLRRKFSRERIGKWWKECRVILSYPIWEIICGLLMACVSFLWLHLGIPIGMFGMALHLIISALIALHGAYRQENWE